MHARRDEKEIACMRVDGVCEMAPEDEAVRQRERDRRVEMGCDVLAPPVPAAAHALGSNQPARAHA